MIKTIIAYLLILFAAFLAVSVVIWTYQHFAESSVEGYPATGAKIGYYGFPVINLGIALLLGYVAKRLLRKVH